MNNDIDLTSFDEEGEDADFMRMLADLMAPPQTLRQSLGLDEDAEIPNDVAFNIAVDLVGALSDIVGGYSEIAEGVEEDGTSRFASRIKAHAEEVGESTAPVALLQKFEDFFQATMQIENELRTAKYPHLPQVDDRGRDIV